MTAVGDLSEFVVVRERCRRRRREETADATRARVREVLPESFDIIELDDRGVLEILRHHLLVSGKAVLDATADRQRADRGNADGCSRERREDGVTILGREVRSWLEQDDVRDHRGPPRPPRPPLPRPRPPGPGRPRPPLPGLRSPWPPGPDPRGRKPPEPSDRGRSGLPVAGRSGLRVGGRSGLSVAWTIGSVGWWTIGSAGWRTIGSAGWRTIRSAGRRTVGPAGAVRTLATAPAVLPIAAELVGEAPAFLVAWNLESIARILMLSTRPPPGSALLTALPPRPAAAASSSSGDCHSRPRANHNITASGCLVCSCLSVGRSSSWVCARKAVGLPSRMIVQ